jgi:lysozyme
MRAVAIGAAVALVGAAVYYAWPAPNTDEGESDSGPDLEDYGQQVLAAADGLIEQGTENTMNQTAFLQALRYGEGTSGPDGYVTLCGGDKFGSYATHPALAGWGGLPLSDTVCAMAGFGPGCVSTAAGAYQINKPTWRRVAAKLGLTDFTPASQDAAAWFLITEKGADADVMAGRTDAAVAKVAKIWASLPGAGYGQREVAMSAFNTIYQNAGGVIA